MFFHWPDPNWAPCQAAKAEVSIKEKLKLHIDLFILNKKKKSFCRKKSEIGIKSTAIVPTSHFFDSLAKGQDVIYSAQWEWAAIIKYQKHFIFIDTLNSINSHLSRGCLSVLCIRQSQDREILNLIYISGVRHWSYMSAATLLPGAMWDWKQHSCLCRVHDLR